jgi:hypothetical protein
MGKVIVVFILNKFLSALLRLESKLIVAAYISVLSPPTELNKVENLYDSLYVHHMGPFVALASERIQKFI